MQTETDIMIPCIRPGETGEAETRGALVLVPTPIGESLPLEPMALKILQWATSSLKEREKTLVIYEEFKCFIRRWIHWGLPRDITDLSIPCNEQNYQEISQEILEQLKRGKRAFLMSDGGLPAFCDPGTSLIDLCHRHGIRVTSTPFPNAPALAIALSGFSSERFIFEGFLPHKDQIERRKRIGQILRNPLMTILMETPYRLHKLLLELMEEMKVQKLLLREVFLALDLNTSQEQLLRGGVESILEKIHVGEKREFVLVLAPLAPRDERKNEKTKFKKNHQKIHQR